MTPDEINKAIAIECGAKWIYTYRSTEEGDKETDQLVLTFNKKYHRSLLESLQNGPFVGDDIPRYYSDLNACHEFEETLRERDGDRYFEELKKLVTGWTWHAKAPQRCEAFLRVKGKWQE